MTVQSECIEPCAVCGESTEGCETDICDNCQPLQCEHCGDELMPSESILCRECVEEE